MSQTPKNAVITASYSAATEAEHGPNALPTYMEDVGARLWTAVLIRGLDKSVRDTKKSEKTLGRYRKGDEPPLGVVASLARATGLSIGWIVTGTVEGPLDADAAVMTFERLKVEAAPNTEVGAILDHQLQIAQAQRNLLKGKKGLTKFIDAVGTVRVAPATRGGLDEPTMTYDTGALSADFKLIPRLDVQPSSGYGALAADEDPTEMLAFRADWLRRVGINPEHARVLTNRGDSNEPTIRDGDVLLVDTSINNIVDNAFYIVVFNGLALLKRVQLRRDGSVVLSSDNKLAYQDEIVPVAEVPDLRIAARLMWFGRSI